MLKIRVKTTEVELEVEDKHILSDNGYTVHSLPELKETVTSVINDCIKTTKEILEIKQKV